MELATSIPLGARALSGRLELEACPSARDETALGHQYHSVPFHLSKPYWDGRALVVQPVNPTAGIFQGDQLSSEVIVRNGARLLLTSPSAARAHTPSPVFENDEALPMARVRQHFSVERSAWLEVYPELLIPQRQSNLRQHTRVELEGDAELYFGEILAPGRLAHGERFAWNCLDWSFELYRDGLPLAVERARVQPSEDPWMFTVPGWKQAYYATFWIVSPALLLRHQGGDPREVIEQLSHERCLIGASRLADDALCVKLLAEDNRILRQRCQALRQRMVHWLPTLQANPRKL